MPRPNSILEVPQPEREALPNVSGRAATPLAYGKTIGKCTAFGLARPGSRKIVKKIQNGFDSRRLV